jgi:hypothetical protein
MQRKWITLGAALSVVVSQASCLFVPDNEGTLTFRYLVLNDFQGVVAARLCDNPDVADGSSFIKSPVSTILITGTSRRGLTVEREAECFYNVPSGDFDSAQELGTLSVKFPADTYSSFKLQMLSAQGTPILWANNPADNFVQENDVLFGLTVEVVKEKELNLGPTFEQLGLDGVVADELKIFVP